MKLIFKSLINNTACVDGARKRKWWVSLLLLFFSLVVVCVPTLVKGLTAKGETIFSSSYYSLDIAFNSFIDNCKNNEIVMTIKDDSDGEKYLTVSNNWVDYTYVNNNNETPVSIAKFWYISEPSAASMQIITEDKTMSHIVFSEREVYCYLKTTQGITGQQYVKAYKDFSNGDLVEFFDDETFSGRISNVKSFFNKVYNYNRVVGAWVNVGILAGVSLVVIALMGLMLFILTRGKRNPYNFITFWESQKIGYWASTAPALLSLILGFLINIGGLLNVWFVMLFGVRVMWISMKQFRPDGTGYEIPKDTVKTVNVKPAK